MVETDPNGLRQLVRDSLGNVLHGDLTDYSNILTARLTLMGGLMAGDFAFITGVIAGAGEQEGLVQAATATTGTAIAVLGLMNIREKLYKRLESRNNQGVVVG